MLKAAVFSAAVSAATCEFVHIEHIDDSYPTDYSTFNRGWSKYLAVSDTASETVTLLAPSYEDSTHSHIELQVLTNEPSGFGRVIDLAGDDVTGQMLWVSSESNAFIYTGEWNKWSVQQTLTAPSEWDDEADRFGYSVDVDRTNFHQGVLGCPNCHYCSNCTVAILPSGQAYVYEATSPSAKSWTQTQVLTAYQGGEISDCADGAVDFTYNLGNKVRISGDSLIASADYSNCGVGGAVLFRKEGKTWSQAQTFWDSTLTIFEMEVQEDTIFLSAENAEYNGLSAVGAVYVQYPNTPEYGVKPKPKAGPTQWSLHQILYPPEAAANDLFGTEISLQGNTAVVGATNANKIYIYERETLGGMWSLQQFIEPSFSTEYYTENTISGHTIITIGKEEGAGGSPLTDIYSESTEWDCLVIAVEDQFGDGWDVARLQITSPDGYTETFAPFCHFANPYTFRWCPRYSSDDGLYKLRVIDAPKAAFFWEIQYRVYEEGTGTWYQGKHDTNMDFHWSSRDLGFSRRAIVHDLPTNITCHTCPQKPKVKPKSSPRRELKGKDTTASPTISPAPTLAQSDVEEWNYVVLSTDSEPWFEEQHRGTNYYVTDSSGRKLITTGTGCGTDVNTCWTDLPDGEYILRVSGALNAYAGDHVWAFCGRTGSGGEQLDFVVRDGECVAITSYTTAEYCADELGAQVVNNVQIVMLGIPETTPLSSLSKADLQTFAEGISSILKGVSSEGVEVSRIYESGGHAVFDTRVTVDIDDFSLDAHQFSSFDKVREYVMNTLSSHSSSGNLRNVISSASVEGSTFFNQLTGAHVGEVVLSKVVNHIPVEVNDMVTSTASQKGSDVPTGGSQGFVDYLGMAGYIVAGIAVLAMAFVAISGAAKSAFSSSTPHLLSTDDKVEVESQSPISTASRPKQIKRDAVDSTKKSIAMNRLMMADLVKMAKDEDENLSRTMRSDHFNL